MKQKRGSTRELCNNSRWTRNEVRRIIFIGGWGGRGEVITKPLYAVPSLNYASLEEASLSTCHLASPLPSLSSFVLRFGPQLPPTTRFITLWLRINNNYLSLCHTVKRLADSNWRELIPDYNFVDYTYSIRPNDSEWHWCGTSSLKTPFVVYKTGFRVVVVAFTFDLSCLPMLYQLVVDLVFTSDPYNRRISLVSTMIIWFFFVRLSITLLKLIFNPVFLSALISFVCRNERAERDSAPLILLTRLWLFLLVI